MSYTNNNGVKQENDTIFFGLVDVGQDKKGNQMLKLKLYPQEAAKIQKAIEEHLSGPNAEKSATLQVHITEDTIATPDGSHTSNKFYGFVKSPKLASKFAPKSNQAADQKAAVKQRIAQLKQPQGG